MSNPMSETRDMAHQVLQSRPRAPTVGSTRLPDWFARVFAHLGHADRLTVQRLWISGFFLSASSPAK